MSCIHLTKPSTLSCGHNTLLSISASCKPFFLAIWDLYCGLSLCHPRSVILGWLTHLLTMSISCVVFVCFFPPGWVPIHHFSTSLVLMNNPSKCKPMRSCLRLANSMYRHFLIILAIPLYSLIIFPLSTMPSIISLMFIFIGWINNVLLISLLATSNVSLALSNSSSTDIPHWLSYSVISL